MSAIRRCDRCFGELDKGYRCAQCEHTHNHLEFPGHKGPIPGKQAGEMPVQGKYAFPEMPSGNLMVGQLDEQAEEDPGLNITIEVSEPEGKGVVQRRTRHTITEEQYRDSCYDVANGLIKSMIRNVNNYERED